MKKFFVLSLLGMAAVIPAHAATVTAVECSSSEIAVTFDGSVTTSDVTALKIGKGSDPRTKYNLDIVSTGTASGATVLKYTVSSGALTNMGKVPPSKAYIFVTGTANGAASCD